MDDHESATEELKTDWRTGTMMCTQCVDMLVLGQGGRTRFAVDSSCFWPGRSLYGIEACDECLARYVTSITLNTTDSVAT